MESQLCNTFPDITPSLIRCQCRNLGIPYAVKYKSQARKFSGTNVIAGCLAAPFVGAQVIASQMTNLMAPTYSASYTSYSTPINEATAGHFFFPSSVKQVDIYFGKAWGNVLSGCRTSMRFALSSVDFDL